jgi:two-component system sensor histidine kinase PilS (NtrC family)
MEDKPLQSNTITYRIRLLILSRLFIVTFILGIAVFANINAGDGYPDISESFFLKTIISIYLLSVVYAVFFYKVRDFTVNIYLQSITDVFAIMAMVYSTGGIHSLYSVFYPVVIIYAVTFLGRRGGLMVASFAALLYGFFSLLEYSAIINPPLPVPFNNYRPDAGYVLTRVFTHIISFYSTAFLSIFVVEQERKTRALLAEKQDAFAQLDILHKGIIESVNAGIITINPEGRIKSFNRAAAEITGFVFSEVENRKLQEVFPDLHDFLQRGKKMDGKYALLTRFEGVFHTNKGRTLKLGASLSPLRDGHGRVIGEIIVFQDIAEIIEMRESLEKSRRLAFTGEVAANLAHEIRNPLATIGGSIQLLKQDIPADHVNQKLFDIIMRGKEQLESFLRDFLLLARPAFGMCEEIELNSTIVEVIDSLRLLPDWRESLKLNLNIPESRVIITANKTEIRQVLWNLILNALQAMPENGVLTVEVSLLGKGDGKSVQITVGDNGCGIDVSEQRRIFEPFYTTRSTGTGLGLAVVNRIIENWQGTIDLKSEPGMGTTFRVTFPSQVSSCKKIGELNSKQGD